MTNGEKLQETFKVYVREVGEGMTRFYIAGIMYLTNTEWWNAEYKEPGIRGNGVKDELNRVKDELGVASELEKNSKLEKIKAEIKAKQDTILYGYDHYDDGVMDGLDCALEIIDKADRSEDT